MHACGLCKPRITRLRPLAAAAMACGLCLCAQTSTTAPQRTPATEQNATSTTAESERQVAEIGEEQLRQQLLGKTFYLRGGYVDDNLHFDENGKLDGASPRESFTLSLVQISRVHLTKHRLELEGDRYGLHFLGALPSEDQSTAVDKVRLTTKKKPLRITIDREQVEKPKKEKAGKGKHGHAAQPGVAASEKLASPQNLASPEAHTADTTRSVAEANRALEAAVDRVFSSGIDARMIATLPEFWQLYYKAAAEHTNYQPADPGVLRQNQVDRKAKLVSVFEPPSNEYAQKNGVAGMAMYQVVVGADGKPQQIAVARPIGFGLDENAVAALRKASFQPALKDGKPVPVLLDVVVEFRIYSKLTEAAGRPSGKAEQPAAPALPGPYSVNRPQ